MSLSICPISHLRQHKNGDRIRTRPLRLFACHKKSGEQELMYFEHIHLVRRKSVRPQWMKKRVWRLLYGNIGSPSLQLPRHIKPQQFTALPSTTHISCATTEKRQGPEQCFSVSPASQEQNEQQNLLCALRSSEQNTIQRLYEDNDSKSTDSTHMNSLPSASAYMKPNTLLPSSSTAHPSCVWPKTSTTYSRLPVCLRTPKTKNIDQYVLLRASTAHANPKLSTFRLMSSSTQMSSPQHIIPKIRMENYMRTTDSRSKITISNARWVAESKNDLNIDVWCSWRPSI